MTTTPIFSLPLTPLTSPALARCQQLANRIADNAIAQDRIAEIELRAGEAVLRAITAPLDSMDENGF